jgi:hypothetical protein
MDWGGLEMMAERKDSEFLKEAQGRNIVKGRSEEREDVGCVERRGQWCTSTPMRFTTLEAIVHQIKMTNAQSTNQMTQMTMLFGLKRISWDLHHYEY